MVEQRCPKFLIKFPAESVQPLQPTDIEKLCDFGYDIVQVHSRLGGGYYMAGREFELAELKLLEDCTASTRSFSSGSWNERAPMNQPR